MINRKIKVFVYVMCVCAVYEYCVYINTHTKYIFWKYLHVYIYLTDITYKRFICFYFNMLQHSLEMFYVL